MNERQKQIISAATDLILSDGIGVSTARIAKAAGVSNGTLFNAFATKQDLIDAIYRETKLGLYAAMSDAANGALTRANLHKNWRNYLDWARTRPQDRRIMALLQDAGLVSDATRSEIDTLFAANAQWIETALSQGKIRGPNVGFVVALIFHQIDLVLDQDLTGEDDDLAFDMLCNAIGLST